MPAGKVHVHHPSIFTEALEQIFSDCNKLLEKKNHSQNKDVVWQWLHLFLTAY